VERATYVALDLETTGLNPERDQIIEVGMVKFAGQRVLDTFSSFVNPGQSIPFQVTQLTGIQDKDVAQAPTIDAVLPKVKQFIGDSAILGHNVGFDRAFLASAGLRLRNPGVDTFELANIVFPHATRYSLTALAADFGITITSAHRALDDADATRQVFLLLCDRARELPLPLLEKINRISYGSRWSLASLFTGFERQRAHSAFGSALGDQLLARGVVARDARFGLLADSNGDQADITPAPDLVSTDIDQMVQLLEAGGRVARRFPGYEHRPQQSAMLKAVAETMRDGGVLMVEAGTGTGKSLAYLIAATHFAASEGQRVVISTNTINLQDQLFQKDIPDLQEILPFEFQATILKGRSNYLCLRKLDALQQAGQIPQSDIQTLIRVLVWAESTTTGDRSELFLPTVDDRIFWSRIAADSESCMGEFCRHFQQGACFLQRARQKAEASHVVIVNHSLLLADVATENAVLPEYRHLVIDEAHHLEDATTQQLSFELFQRIIEQEVNLLGSVAHGRGRQYSLVHQIVAEIAPHLPAAVRRDVELLSTAIDQILVQIKAEFEEFLAAIAIMGDEYADATGVYGLKLRVTDAIRKLPAWSQIEIQWDNVATHLADLHQKLERLRAYMRDAENVAELASAPELTRDLNARIEFWNGIRAEVSAIISNPRDNRIEWIEVTPREDLASLHSAPLHVGDMIDQHLISRHHAVIMTSATLTTGADFSYLKDRLGAYDAGELSVGSPFDYRASTLLYFPTNMPEPSAPFYQQTSSKIIETITQALHGRTLVLFTSYSHLRATVEQVGESLANAGITVLAQGSSGSRAQLLERFRDEKAAVLFGTRSFWEGIDVVGPALSCVIITRIPFSVPSDPIFAARSETFEDAFNEYSVPDAVLRFRQGFGRLIRSKADRGAVVILDRRLFTKRYGQTFLRSLPSCTSDQGPVEFAGERVARWVDGR
jgi:ATP-dependent DNA helicase DinG